MASGMALAVRGCDQMNLFADIRELVVAELEAMMAEGVLPKGMDLGAVAV